MDEKNNIDEILKKGYQHLEKGEYKDAQKTYLKGLTRYPDSIYLLNNLAESYTLDGNFKKAKAYHQKLISLTEKKSDPDILLLRANSQKSLNYLSDALESLDNILTMDPDNSKALLEKARIHSKRGEFEKSDRLLEKILKNDDDNTTALLEMAMNSYMRNKLDDAVRYCDMILESDPTHDASTRLKGKILNEKGNRSEILKHVNKTLKIKPDCAYTTMLKAMLFASINKTEHAIRYFNRAILLDPYLDEAYFNKAGLLLLLKDYDAATTCYEKAFEINPESGGITDKKGLFELIRQMKEAENEK